MKQLLILVLVGMVMSTSAQSNDNTMKNRQIEIDGLSIFYREAGNPDKETILMLHGFPSSSHMYRNVIEGLSNDYHIIAPDYPGFGFSDTPSPEEFEYTFDSVTKVVEQFIIAVQLDEFYLMMQDYGGPIGLRIATAKPERIKGLIIQNANAYMQGLGEWPQKMKALQDAEDFEGLTTFKDWLMSGEGLKAMYLDGASDATKVDPISYLTDEAFLQREGNNEIQTALFQNYGSNFPKYPEWQAYLKKEQPKTLVLWGVNDKFFSKPGGEAYRNDLKDVEIHFFDGSHFLLEEYGTESIELIKNFIQ